MKCTKKNIPTIVNPKLLLSKKYSTDLKESSESVECIL